MDLNEDNKPDIVIEQIFGTRSVYLQRDDGSFKKLEDAQNYNRTSIKDKLRNLK